MWPTSCGSTLTRVCFSLTDAFVQSHSGKRLLGLKQRAMLNSNTTWTQFATKKCWKMLTKDTRCDLKWYFFLGRYSDFGQNPYTWHQHLKWPNCLLNRALRVFNASWSSSKDHWQWQWSDFHEENIIASDFLNLTAINSNGHGRRQFRVFIEIQNLRRRDCFFFLFSSCNYSLLCSLVFEALTSPSLLTGYGLRACAECYRQDSADITRDGSQSGRFCFVPCSTRAWIRTSWKTGSLSTGWSWIEHFWSAVCTYSGQV